MARFLLLFFVLLIHNFSYAQSNLDSLGTLLDKTSNQEERIELLKKLSKGYSRSNPKKCRTYIDEGLKNSSDDAQKAFFLSELGYNYRVNGQSDSARYYFEKSKELYLKKRDSSSYYSVNYSIANLLRTKGEYEEALDKVTEAVHFFQPQKDSLSKHSYLEGQLVFANIYASIRDAKASVKHLEEIIKEKEFLKGQRLLNIAYLNAIGQYIDLKDYDQSQKYADLAIASSTSDYSKGYTKLNIGNMYSRQKQLEKAFLHFEEALEHLKKANSTSGMITAYNNIGNNYRKRGVYAQAEKALLEANKLLKIYGPYSSLEANYEFLKNLFREQEAYQKASNIQVNLAKLRDSMMNVEKQIAFSEFQVKYDTDKIAYEKEVAEVETRLANSRSVRNRNYFIGAIVIALLILVSALFYVERTNAKKKTEIVTLELKASNNRLKLEKQYRESELKALKAQMNPHFFFNALTSIQDYIFLNKKREAGNYLGMFADLMRKNLEHSDKGSLNLQDELDSLSLYLELERLRFGDKFSYKVSVSDKLDLDTRIPTMLIQPYVENSLKHGLLHKKGDQSLWITFSELESNTITCSIKDNGIGRKKAAEIKNRNRHFHKSFATKATENRLDLLNFNKERKVNVKIVDFEQNGISNGTEVILTIPIIKENN